MAVKKAKTVKAAKKSIKKKTTVNKTKKGEKYGCRVCGIAIRVNDVCGCAEEYDIICCDTKMKPKK